MSLKKEIKFIKGNKYVDPKGKILTLSSVIDKGNVFTTDDNRKICLTDKLVNKLKLLNESIYSNDYKNDKVIGIVIKFSDEKDSLTITDNSLMGFNTWSNLPTSDNSLIGYMCVNFDTVTLGKYTLDYLTRFTHVGTIKVMFDNSNFIEYQITFISSFQRIDRDLYVCLFQGYEKK